MQKLTQLTSRQDIDFVTAAVNENSIDCEAAGQSRVTSTRLSAKAQAPIDKPSQLSCSGIKVNHRRLSKLMRAILSYIDIDKGVKRSDLVLRLYNLEQRHCNRHTYPCFGPKEKREYKQRYRCAQAAVTRALKKLENYGLVCLTRHKRYVKRVSLSSGGRMLMQSKN